MGRNSGGEGGRTWEGCERKLEWVESVFVVLKDGLLKGFRYFANVTADR